MRIFKTLFQIEIKQVAAENDQTEAQCKTFAANFASERSNIKNARPPGELWGLEQGAAGGKQIPAEVRDSLQTSIG